VVLPLVMAIVMGMITLTMALKYPDQAIIRSAASPAPASIKAEISGQAESGRAD
jgi:hypothetical protein